MRPALLAPLSVALLAVGGCAATSSGPAGLPGDVTAARIDWRLPATGDHAAPTTLTEAAARSLVRAIATAPAWPDGRYDCPDDDGSTATITFLRSGRAVGTADARLTGCARIGGRKMTAAAASILTDAGPRGIRVFSNA